jgi:hypothetical protein
MQLTDYLKALRAAAAIVPYVREVRAVFEAASSLLKGEDQDAAKEALHDLANENDEGFARLDAKLEAAKNR